jgi:hypothetical protein
VIQNIPFIFLMHPVGIGSTRAMNVASAKMWIRALVDILPDVSISAPWLPYAEVNVDRERGLRDAFVGIARHDGAVAVGGDFSLGMVGEWERFGALRLPRIDLTRSPMPGILTQDTFVELRTSLRQKVIDAFSPVMVRAAA